MPRFAACLLSAAVLCSLAGPAYSQNRPLVHAVTDLGHEFTFYTDGRFHQQYLPGQPVVSSWGALSHFDFSNANLLVLLGCDPHLKYVPEDIETITHFLQEGGGLVLLGSSRDAGQNALAATWGAAFGKPAQKPLKPVSPLHTGEIVGGGETLNLRETNLWQVLITDAAGAPVLARRTLGKGTLLVGARSLAGQNPDAKDNINASWWQPLLVETAAGKTVDRSKPFHSRGLGQLEHTENLGELRLHYSDYLKPYAKSMADIYLRCRPVIEKRMGVPLSKGMASEIGLLATGGGGFSSGQMLGLAVFWGDFPDREDSMIEFITHESVHSWVLPFAEIWNEPIATYIGNLVMIDMGHEAEALRRIESTIKRASRIDPTMKVYNIDGKGPDSARKLNGGEANDIHWGKTFWIFEELRKENPNVVADYFKAKRRLATPEKIKKYDADVTVALLSVAMKRDLFPWFREHGFAVGGGPVALAFEHPSGAAATNDFCAYQMLPIGSPPVAIDASKATLITNGMTLGQVVTNLGPGWMLQTESIGIIRWRFSDGRELNVWPKSHSSPFLVLSTNVHAHSRFWFSTNRHALPTR